jgi:hypothetical protein
VPSFKGWVHQKVAKACGDYRPEIVNAAWENIRYRAEQRGRQALVQAMGLEKSIQYSADVRHAIDMVVAVVVAGVFGEIPLTQEEKDAKFKLFEEGILAPLLKESYLTWQAQATKSKPVTMADIEAAAKQLQGASYHFVVHPEDKVVYQYKHDAYGPVTMGTAKAPKSGLPAAQDKTKAEEAALGELLAVVEKKSDELLGIKQKAKYEELAGIDPEEI